MAMQSNINNKSNRIKLNLQSINTQDLPVHYQNAIQMINKKPITHDEIFRNLLSDNDNKYPAIGGHRGMGENLWNESNIFHMPNIWRENTIKSFLQAKKHGVNFIELDVQVTKDGIPIIWHDNEVIFGSPLNPISCQVKDLTIHEFESIGHQFNKDTCQLHELIPLYREFRSRKTRQNIADFNPWKCFVEDEIPTLENVLKQLPNDLAINIEIKMTTPNTVPMTDPKEIDRIINAIMNTINKLIFNCKYDIKNTLLFSSFDPDICIALKEIQNLIPIMFLSNGIDNHVDSRRTSLDAAFEFCMKYNLNGLVVESSILRSQKSFIDKIYNENIKIMTYGLANDDIDWLIEQSNLGVHGIIVDDVAVVLPKLISKLTM